MQEQEKEVREGVREDVREEVSIENLQEDTSINPDMSAAPQSKTFICTICNESFNGLVQLVTHVVEHSITLAALMAKQFCPDELRCPKDQDSKRFKIQIFGATGISMFFCPKCEYVDSNEENLITHVEVRIFL